MTVSAESKEMAEKTALNQAEKLDNKKWEYNEDYFQYEKPHIQVENTEENMT